jgi:hypothetical protein
VPHPIYPHAFAGSERPVEVCADGLVLRDRLTVTLNVLFAAPAAVNSPAAEAPSLLPMVTPNPRPGRKLSGRKHQHERRKNARKSLAGTKQMLCPHLQRSDVGTQMLPSHKESSIDGQ